MIQWLKRIVAPQRAPVTPSNRWNVRAIDLAWSTTGNVRIYSDTHGSFGNADMLQVRFTTPGIHDVAGLQVAFKGGQPQVQRVMTLATEPGLVSDKYIPVRTGLTTVEQPSGPIVGATTGITPFLRVEVGVPSRTGIVGLKPDTLYYMTIVNRNGFGGAPSCPGASCDVYIDFTN